MDPELPDDLMEQVITSEKYLQSVNQIAMPDGISMDAILCDKELHVIPLEYVVEKLLQNFLVSTKSIKSNASSSVLNVYNVQSASDDNNDLCMQLAHRFFRGCTVLAFLHSYFDRRLARCTAKEVLGVPHFGRDRELSDAEWTDSMVKLESFMEIMGRPST